MALATVESTEETKVVPYLEDAQAEFVSIVDHAANREPFKIIKKEKDKENLVVASLIIPKEQTVETLKSEKGLEWLPDLNAENAQTFEAWTQFPVTEAKKFDPASFTIKELGSSGAYAVVGQLKPSAKQEGDIVTFPGPGDLSPMAPLTPDANDLPIATELVPITHSFSDLFYKELDGFVGVVQGTLSQSAMDPKKRKAAVMSALQAFGSFLSMAVDALGAQAAKMEKPADTLTLADVIKHIDSALITAQKNDTGGIDMLFETQDELKAFIVDTVQQTMKAEKEQEAAQAQEVQVEKTDTSDNTEQLTKAVSDLTDTVKKLQDDLKTVAEKQDNFEHTVLGSPSSPEDIAQKNDKPTSKWSGIFV